MDGRLPARLQVYSCGQAGSNQARDAKFAEGKIDIEAALKNVSE